MIDRDVALLLTGAAIALGSSLITAWFQHYLSLRAERIKMEWEREREEAARRRRELLLGVRERTFTQVVKGVAKVMMYVAAEVSSAPYDVQTWQELLKILEELPPRVLEEGEVTDETPELTKKEIEDEPEHKDDDESKDPDERHQDAAE